jgi:hypothetical protein
MKLVVDNSNVEQFPASNVRDLPSMARALADDLDKGLHGEVVSLITIMVRPDGLAISWWGENCTPYELMGLFEAAKLRVFADDAIGDEE